MLRPTTPILPTPSGTVPRCPRSPIALAPLGSRLLGVEQELHHFERRLIVLAQVIVAGTDQPQELRSLLPHCECFSRVATMTIGAISRRFLPA